MAGNVKTDLINEQSTDAGVDIPDLKLTETGGPTKLKMGAVADGLFLTRSGTSIVGTASPVAVITGQFSDSTDQKPSVTTPVAITLNTNDITPVGLSHSETVNPEEFTADITKTFTWMLAPQWDRTSSGGVKTIDFFAQLDTGSGFVNIVNSNVKTRAESKDSDVIPLMVSIAMTVGDKIRFMQRVESTTDGLGIKFTAADSEVPATPSVILTVYSGD